MFFHACNTLQRIVRNNIFFRSCLVVAKRSLIIMVKDALHSLNGLNINLNSRIIEHKKCPCKCIATMKNLKLLVPLQLLFNLMHFVFSSYKFCIQAFIHYVCWLLQELTCHNANKFFCFILPNN
jgi:hypothetical protein